MRLGVVGMLPRDPEAISARHLAAIRALRLTGGALSVSAADSPPASAPVWQRVRRLFADEDLDLVQVGLGFQACLFDPDAETRRRVLEEIRRGIGIASELGGQVALIRSGSLSPNGAYSPHRDNHRLECRARLLDSLHWVADAAEALDQTVVVETHLLTIMRSPEVNYALITEVGSARLRLVMDYVNHFQALHQVYESSARLHHIFDLMGRSAPSATARISACGMASSSTWTRRSQVKGAGPGDRAAPLARPASRRLYDAGAPAG